MEYKKQVEENHYAFHKYVFKERWISYWHQINEITTHVTKGKVLDIGPGSDFMRQTLSVYAPNINYLSMDIDEATSPDYIGSVTEIPLESDAMDCVTAFQVLEHIKYEDVEVALDEIARVTKKYAIISLPHFGPQSTFSLKIPFIPKIEFAFKFPWPKKLEFEGQHYWEIGRRGYPLKRVRKTLEENFILEKEFVPFQNQYHRFFVLGKRA